MTFKWSQKYYTEKNNVSKNFIIQEVKGRVLCVCEREKEEDERDRQTETGTQAVFKNLWKSVY